MDKTAGAEEKMCEIDKEDRNRGDMWLRDSVEKRE
jgi:hypothetical protein